MKTLLITLLSLATLQLSASECADQTYEFQLLGNSTPMTFLFNPNKKELYISNTLTNPDSNNITNNTDWKKIKVSQWNPSQNKENQSSSWVLVNSTLYIQPTPDLSDLTNAPHQLTALSSDKTILTTFSELLKVPITSVGIILKIP